LQILLRKPGVGIPWTESVKMLSLYTPHDRQVVANRASADIAQKTVSIINTIERNLSNPGPREIGPQLLDLFNLVDRLFDDVFAHDQKEAEFQLTQAIVSGKAPGLNPFSEEREEQLLVRVRGQFTSLVKTLRDPGICPKISRLLEEMPNEIEARRTVNQTDLTHRLRQKYLEHRSEFNLKIRAFRADNKADKKQKKWASIPKQTDVLKLAKKIRQERNSGRTKTDIAREITEGNERKAQTLLRELRRYPHLLD